MNKFSLYGIALLSIYCMANANATPTDSEKILSGFHIASNVESLPDEIELPAVWTQVLRDLSKKSLETNAAGTEYGVCLNVVARGIGGDRRQHMDAYRLLLKEKINMTGAEFEKRARELRRRIAGNENDQYEGMIWNSGKIQTGDDSKITVEHGNTVCDGEVVSDAHTHPEMDTEVMFSLQDLLSFIASRKKSSFVINSSFATCLFVRTDATADLSNNYYWDVTTEVTPYRWSDQYIQRFAWYAQTIGVGFYCGNLEQKMRRIIPQKLSPPNVKPGFYLLAAKAYLSYLERLENNPVRVASNFHPEIDDIFSNYLTVVLPQKPHYTKLYKGDFKVINSTPAEIFRYALSFYHPKNKDPLLPIANINCFTSITDEGCISADDLWKNKPKRLFSSFSYIKQESYWVEGNESIGFFRISENLKDRNNYSGTCKFHTKECLPDGDGILKTSDFEYRGGFKAGKMEGNGEIRKIPQNAFFRVKMANGEIKEIKHAQ